MTFLKVSIKKLFYNFKINFKMFFSLSLSVHLYNNVIVYFVINLPLDLTGKRSKEHLRTGFEQLTTFAFKWWKLKILQGSFLTGTNKYTQLNIC